MSPTVMEGGAKGPRMREIEIHRERDLRRSDWRRKMEAAMKRRERETHAMRRGLLWRPVAGESVAGEDAAADEERDWKRNLGRDSSSKKSIFCDALSLSRVQC